MCHLDRHQHTARAADRGASILEALLAIAVFGVLASGVLVFVWAPLTASGSSAERARAMGLAKEGVAAMASLRSEEWYTLTDGVYGIAQSGGKWVTSGSSDVTDGFTRSILVTSIFRNGSGDIVTTGGANDRRSKIVTATVTWDSIYGGSKSLDYTEILTDWNVYDWRQTTDAHFNAGTYTQTALLGSGESASVELATSTGTKEWTSNEGELIVHTADTDWSSATLQDTIVVGTGEPTTVQGTGAPQWIQIQTGIELFETSDTDFADGSFASTVGVDTGDLGAVTLAIVADWADMTSPGNEHLNAVAFSSAINGFAVGQTGSIVRWNGTAWSTETSPVNSHLYGVSMVSASDGWIVGAGGVILRWNGSAWSSVTSPVSNDLHSVAAVSANDVWAVGASGKIIHWNGTAWSETTDTGNDSWNDITMVSATDGWIVSGGGKSRRYVSGSWTNVNTGTNKSLESVDCASASVCFAVGAQGIIIYWNGSAWSTPTSPTASTIWGVDLITSTDGWAVGAGGLLLRWNGTAWSLATNPTSTLMSDIAMISSNEAYAVGNNSDIWQLGDHYAVNGTYTSGVFDAGSSVVWGHLFWDEELVNGSTELTLQTRTGNTIVPDGTWSAWSATTTDPFNSPIASPNGRYLQYRANMTTSDKFQTPRLNAVSVTHTEPGGATFFDVTILPGNTDGWAVGQGGALSRFDGTQWSSYASPTSDTLLAVDHYGTTNVWAVGDNGRIIYWNGTSWATQTSGTTRTLYGIHIVSPTSVYAVGQSGTVLHFNGTAWSEMGTTVTQQLNKISMVSDSDGWAVGNNGTILRWNGSAWSEYASPTTSPLNGVDMVNASFGVIVGSGGQTYHWNGTAWLSVISATPNELEDVHCIAIDVCWAVGVEQTFTYWDGAVWSDYVFDNPSNPLMRGVYMISDSDGWVVGEGGAFFHYTAFIPSPAYLTGTVVDGGTVGLVWNTISWDSVEPLQTAISMAVRTGPTPTPDGSWSAWSAESANKGGTTIVSPANQYLQYRVRFTNTNPSKTAVLQEIRIIHSAATGQDLYSCDGTAVGDVWAVGRAGTIVHYGGTNWTSYIAPGVGNINGVDAVTASLAYAVGDGGTIYKWNGSIWAAETSPTSQGLNGVHCATSSFCAAVGQSGTIVHYTGTTWNTVSSPTAQNLNDVHLLSATEGYAVGAAGVILTWDGVSWASDTSPTAQQLNGVHSISSSLAWAVGANGVILKWDGVSWASVTSPVVSNIHAVESRTASEGWAAADFGTILYWDGVSWASYLSPTSRTLYDVTVEAPTDGWMCGKTGSLLKDPPPYFLTGTFTSQVLDTDSASTEFGDLYFTVSLPGVTTATVALRSGDTPTPDGTWSAWSAELTAGNVLVPVADARYLQYRVTLNTSNSSVSPTFDDFLLTYRQ